MNTRRQGAAYEGLAEQYLIGLGAKLLERNYRALGAEIDRIVRLDGVIVFVEVKQRTTGRYGSPGAAVTLKKQAQISRAALMYLQQNHLLDASARFDVVEISDDGIRHLRSAFPFRGGYKD